MTMMVEIVIFLAAAVIMVLITRRFGLGAVLGYLAAGILIGPWMLGLIEDVDTILHFAELGVVFLLFVIGLELKPSRLRVFRHMVFYIGTMQMLLTTLALWPLAAWWLNDWGTGLLVAVVLSLSSTAIGLQMLAEKKQLASSYGRQAFGILLLQDIAVIPLLAIIPLYAPAGLMADEGPGMLYGFLEAAAVIAGIVIGGRYLLRPLFRIIAHTGIHEIFLAAALLVVLGTALLAEIAGLSMALGAFLAGVLLADSEYRHELEAGIDPFKGLLLGLFFIAVGMSIDFGRVLSTPETVLAAVAILMSVKFLVLLVVGRLAGLDRASTLSLAFALPQAGEFAFVLFAVAVGAQVIPSELMDQLIVAVTISMALTPLMYFINERLVQPRLAADAAATKEYDTIEEQVEPAVIIAGFGRVGQIVGRVLSMLDIHFTALDNNPGHVEFVGKFGHKIYFGDATNPDVLNAAGAGRAKLFVLTISDIETSVRTAQIVRRRFPDLRIHVRARNRQHAMELMALGVDYVMRETWLSSLEMARETLEILGVRKAGRLVEMFQKHDEYTLRQQIEHRDDEAELARLARRSREQLEELFQEDRRLLHEEDKSSE